MTYSFTTYLAEGKNSIFEERKDGVPYTEKQVSGKLDRVTARLEGSASGVLTKLAAQLHAANEQLEKLTKEKKKLTDRIGDEVSDMFDPQDIVLTRVVETASFSLMLAKEIEKVTPKSEVKDFEAIARELTKLIPAELTSKIEEITALYTSSIPETTKPGTRKLTVGKLDEGVLKSIGGVIRAVGAAIKRLTKWGTSFDNKLDTLKRELETAKATAKKKPVAESKKGEADNARNALEDLGEAKGYLDGAALRWALNNMPKDDRPEARDIVKRIKRDISDLQDKIRGLS